MVKILYSFDKQWFKGKALSKAFVLTNKYSGFYIDGLDSRYNGLHFKIDDRFFKIIDEIKLDDEPQAIQHNFYNIQKIGSNFIQTFFFPFNRSSFVYETDDFTSFDLFLDFRNIDDDRQWGRFYRIYNEKNKLVIEFTKKTDSREDKSHNQLEYKIYLVIQGVNLRYEILDNWVKRNYSHDAERGISSERYVYHALKLTSPIAVFSVSANKKEASKEAELVMENLARLKQLQKKYFSQDIKNLENKKLSTAYKCAAGALDSLLTSNGLYAGLPWFNQVWSRDELVSLKALMIEREFEQVKYILVRNINNITEEGKLPNRIPASSVSSSDSIYWLYIRFYDFIKKIKKHKVFDKYFSKKEYNELVRKLEKTIDLIHKNRLKDGMIYSEKKSTWMDTLDREGCCIEIQALQLAAYSVMYNLTKKQKYSSYEKVLKEKVKKEFWNKKFLADKLGDFTIRPNIFIAAYAYPSLLTKKQWIECFSNILPKLWLQWGGLSSIDINDPKFQGIDTGFDPKAYHCGDSWFWINNMAALAMLKTDKDRFKDYINKIADASANEILFNGFLGANAEISDALQFRSRGCFIQAWSSALFIELMSEYK